MIERLSLFVNQLSDSLDESRDAFKDFCLKLSRSYIFFNDTISPEDLSLWLRFVEDHAIPLNNKTAYLIEQNRNLWKSMPIPLDTFLSYHYEWLASHYAWKADRTVKYSYHAKDNFPQSINDWTAFMKTIISHLAIEEVEGNGKS